MTFPLSTRNSLCFLQHSRFASARGKPPLCFHRHSRFVPSILKNAFSLSLPCVDLLSTWNSEVFRAFASAWDTFESGLGARRSIAAICSREAMTASLVSTYYPSLSSFTCQETGCPLWSMEGARGRGGLGPCLPAGAPMAPLPKAAGGGYILTKTVGTYAPPAMNLPKEKPQSLCEPRLCATTR